MILTLRAPRNAEDAEGIRTLSSRSSYRGTSSRQPLTFASAAILGGWARVHFGDYQYAFLVGGCMGLIAACLALTIDRQSIGKPEMAVTTELAGA